MTQTSAGPNPDDKSKPAGTGTGSAAGSGGTAPDLNTTAEERLAALNLELKRIQHEVELAGARQSRLTDEVNQFSSMLGQVKKFESDYGRAQEQALVKKLHQPYVERIEEAKAVLKDKHHGSLEKIDEIIKAFPGKISHLESQVTKAEDLLATKKEEYDDSVENAADCQTKLNDQLNIQADYEKLAAKGIAAGDQVNQFEQASDYAGMYLYAKDWEESLKNQHPPTPKDAAKSLNDALIAVDEANKEVRQTKVSFDDATTKLATLQARLADMQANKLTLLLAEIHDKIPSTKPSA